MKGNVMYRETDSLILYSSLPQDSILMKLSGIWSDWESQRDTLASLTHRIYTEVKRILDISTAYGFDRNLWQCYLTFVMISHENSFALTCERRGPKEGTINLIAKHDFDVFLRLLHFDFGPIEESLKINCFSLLCEYQAIPKRQQLFNRHVSERVCALSEKLACAKDADEVFDLVTDHFSRFGVGLFGLNRAFRLQEHGNDIEITAINNMDAVTLSDLIGYDAQKAEIRANVEAFLAGRPFNNMLLYGDAGTGKSTSVKALLNEYWEDGLRIIELYKNQFSRLSEVISTVKNRQYRFMIFIDDLSFEENEVEYKYLKAVIEGGLESRPDNVMICATSNRRHLIRETWNDRNDMEHNGDVHRSDTMQEKLSLAARFGCAVSYSAPGHRLFQEIVKGIAQRYPELQMTEEELLLEANRFEIRHGGESGRCAQQFINMLVGRIKPSAGQ